MATLPAHMCVCVSDPLADAHRWLASSRRCRCGRDLCAEHPGWRTTRSSLGLITMSPVVADPSGGSANGIELLAPRSSWHCPTPVPPGARRSPVVRHCIEATQAMRGSCWGTTPGNAVPTRTGCVTRRQGGLRRPGRWLPDSVLEPIRPKQIQEVQRLFDDRVPNQVNQSLPICVNDLPQRSDDPADPVPTTP
jgi:hypothetical protein